MLVQSAMAQDSELDVAETEAPEDEVIAPQPDLDQPVPVEEVARGTIPADTEEPESTWDITAPPGATIRQVPIRTDEGTWMDVDVSPDGRTVAFALLGDIYTMPISGGRPTRISEGLAWEVQPRFSPDGRRIAFTSDRGGADNIWIMNADGSNKAQVTEEKVPPVEPAELESGRTIHSRQEAFHHRTLAWHGRSVGLSRIGRRRRASLSRGRMKRIRRNWASQCMPPTASRCSTPAT